MVNILLVEDSGEKAAKIEALLKSSSQVSELLIAKSNVDAIRLLRSKQFDLMILDLQIPMRAGQEPNVDGGLNLLESLSTGENLPLYVIGLTSFDTSITRSSKRFHELLWSLLKYDPASTVWEKQILQKISYLSDLKKNTQILSRRFYDFKLAIITAVKIEFDAAKKLANNWDTLKLQGDAAVYYVTRLNIGGVEVKTVLALAPEMGMPAATSLSTKMINNFSPELLIMVGIAAGMSKEIMLGDLVIADPSWDYSSGKRVRDNKGRRLLPDPKQRRLSTSLLGIFQDILNDPNISITIWKKWSGAKPKIAPKIYIAPMASGSSVVADKAIAIEIKSQSRKAKSIDMETYGVYYAAENAREPLPRVASLKSICDFADARKNDHYQAFCAYFSVEVLREFLSKYLKLSDN